MPEAQLFGTLIPEWVANPFFSGCCQPRDQTWFSCTAKKLPGKPICQLQLQIYYFHFVSPLLNMHRSFTLSSYYSFFLIIYLRIFLWKNMHNIGFTGGSVVKKEICLPMQETQDMGLIPESGRSLGGGNDTHSSILAWKIPWTEEPGRLQSMGLQRVRHD